MADSSLRLSDTHRGVQRGGVPLRFFSSPKNGGRGVEKESFEMASQRGRQQRLLRMRMAGRTVG
jgi:hypothetical protein